MNGNLKYSIIIWTIVLIMLGIAFKLGVRTDEKKINYDDKIVFLGDSITSRYDLKKYYGDYTLINSGVAGNQTSDILNDLENRIYKYNPNKVVLLIGTNDLVYSGLSNEEIKNNIVKIVNSILNRNPKTKIYLQSIYPVNKKVKVNIDVVETRSNENIKELNSNIETICKNRKCRYINIYDKLIDKNGNLKRIYTKDGLHLNNIGYYIITKEIKNYICE